VTNHGDRRKSFRSRRTATCCRRGPTPPGIGGRKYHPTIVTSRSVRIGQLVLSVAFAGLGIWALAEGDHLKGAFYLTSSVVWLLIAAFRDGLVAARERSAAVSGLRSGKQRPPHPNR